jgi:hypothetical protein
MSALQTAFHSFIDSFSLIRVFYTLLLLIVVLLLLTIVGVTTREIIATWSTRKIYLSDFSFFADGAKVPQHAEQIRNESILYYRYIRGLIDVAKQQRDSFSQPADESTDTSSERRPVVPEKYVFDKEGILPEIDLSVQGVNIKALLASFAKLVSPADPEISATIITKTDSTTKSESSRRVYISLPEPRKRAQDDESDTAIASPYIIESANDDSDTALRIACFLIWSQSSNDRDATFANRESTYSEFCEWARLLRISSSLDAEDMRTTDLGPAKDYLDTLVKYFDLAFSGKIQYKNILSTLSTMEKYVADRTISIGKDKEATIGAIADILRYVSITRNGPPNDWTAGAPAKLTDATEADKLFFAKQFVRDCSDADKKAAYPNVVRIVFQYKSSSKTKIPVVMGGLLLGDERVLTYLPRYYPVRDQEGIPIGATVQRILCGAIVDEKAVTALAPAVGTAKSDTFLLLTVPGLSISGAAPKIDFDATEEEIDEVQIAGFLRNSDATFVRPPSPTTINTNELYLASASEVQTMRTVRDLGNLLLFDAAFSPGMIGSPFFSKDGTTLGMITGGIYVNNHLRLRLARGLLLHSLKDKFPGSAATSQAPAK